MGLNVGGRKVSTARSTLTSCPDSVLARMFSPDSNPQSASTHMTVEGSVYTMDTDPDCFQVILDWLRYRQLMIPSNLTPNAVAVVAEFFGLQAMVQQLRQEPKTTSKPKTVVCVYQRPGKDSVTGLESLSVSDPDIYSEIQRQRGKLAPTDSMGLLRILVDVGGFSVKSESVVPNNY